MMTNEEVRVAWEEIIRVEFTRSLREAARLDLASDEFMRKGFRNGFIAALDWCERKGLDVDAAMQEEFLE